MGLFVEAAVLLRMILPSDSMVRGPCVCMYKPRHLFWTLMCMMLKFGT